MNIFKKKLELIVMIKMKKLIDGSKIFGLCVKMFSLFQ